MGRRTLEVIAGWNELAWHYKRKGSRVVRYFPEMIRERKVLKESDAIEYIVVYNNARSDELRPGADAPVSCSKEHPCPFDDKLDEEQILADKEYGPWRICINVFPFEFGSSLIIHEQCPGRPQNDIQKEDLEYMLKIAFDTDYRIFHNSVPDVINGKRRIGTASTIDHLHFQAVMSQFPIEKAEKAMLDENIFTMKNYPGANIIFAGEKTANAVAAIKKLDELGIARTIVIANNEIYLFPRKKEISELTCKRVGGYELGGRFVVSDIRKNGQLIRCGNCLYENITYDDIEKALKEVVYSTEELAEQGLDIKDLAKCGMKAP